MGIHKAQAFLLAAANQQGAVNLHAVYVHQILVVVATPDRILGTQFVVGADSRKSNQQGFDAASRRVGQKADIGNIDFLQAACASLLSGNHCFIQGLGAGCHSDVQHQLIDFYRDYTNSGLVRKAAVIQDQGVLPGQFQFVIAALIAGCSLLSILLKDVDQLYGPFVAIHHKSCQLDCVIPGNGRQPSRHHKCKEEKQVSDVH